MTTDACSPVPALTGRFDGIDLSLLDLNDEHDRSLLILAEHPELHAAIRSGREQIHHHGRVVNSAPHLAMHEIVANQSTGERTGGDVGHSETSDRRRLSAARGVAHVGTVVSGDVLSARHDNQPHDPQRTRAAVAALSGSWEHLRAEIPAERHANRAERRSEARNHRR